MKLIPKDPFFAESETPMLVGRAIAALAADPGRATQRARIEALLGLS